MSRGGAVRAEVPALSVRLRADVGEGERSLVELSVQQLALHYRRARPHHTALQVRLYSLDLYQILRLHRMAYDVTASVRRQPSGAATSLYN